MTPITTVQQLVIITGLIDNRFLTPQERWDMAEVTDELLKTVKTHEKMQKKTVEDLGGRLEINQYRWDNAAQGKDITKALVESAEVEVDIIRNTHVLSRASIEKFTGEVSTTSPQLNLIREYFLKPEK